jgi:hypothetical protein
MTSFTFTADQIRSAPAEVHRWIENEILTALTVLDKPVHDPSHVPATELAACTPDEALQVLELIKGNFLLTQVFFELARELPNRQFAAPLHALDVGTMLRNTRLSDSGRLSDCLAAINQAFQRVRNDPEAALFGFDQHGDVYVHEATHLSVRRLWQQLTSAHASASALGPDAGPPASLNLPHLGPSEAVAGHAPNPGNSLVRD